MRSRSIRSVVTPTASKGWMPAWSRPGRRAEPMPLDLSVVGVQGEPAERSWTSKDAILYAIGVGAGLGDPLQERQFTTENSSGIEQQVLPTYGVLIAQAGARRRFGDFDPAMLVHAEQGVTLHQAIPVEGSVQVTSRVTGIYDKGSGALVTTEAV